MAILLFAASVTYTEPLLWFTVQGIPLATFFVGLAFYFWLKNRFFWSILFSFFSGFVFGVGVGVGVVFAFVTLVWKRKWNYIFFYLMTGIISYLIGPVLLAGRVGSRVIEFGRVGDIFAYAGFVVVGVGRGVVGRLFLPGFEPPNEDIVGTVMSFIPFIVILGVIGWIVSKKIYQTKAIFLTLIFVVYPYVWAGFLRYQFGLKQALAERYAYPSLFFFVILVAHLVNYMLKERIVRSQKLFIGGAIILFFFQLYFFQIKARAFEIRPLMTKKYFETLEGKIKRGEKIKDEQLPKFTNQEFYTEKQLLPIFVMVKRLI